MPEDKIKTDPLNVMLTILLGRQMDIPAARRPSPGTRLPVLHTSPFIPEVSSPMNP